MSDCITVKENKFVHQPIYDGPGDGVHCHFCGKHWATRVEAMREINMSDLAINPYPRKIKGILEVAD